MSKADIDCLKNSSNYVSVISYEENLHIGINEDLKTQRNQGLALHFCSTCDYSTWNKAHLKRHMAVHTGEKPFACPVCGRRFSLKWNMKSHMVTTVY
ncbi:zinc finger protein 672-like isoform X5 [Parasteatoda tepidariorum]|uniref:zinc finger protein 672-like isoform X5 n=1 Tax=Parasteatoda tepidariorum TaxID=114398 RepID=UPI001C71CC27|nr:protein krueppel-like isoform X4 [Parasteatoda tepidariorum]